jgi:hypothetical protein
VCPASTWRTAITIDAPESLFSMSASTCAPAASSIVVASTPSTSTTILLGRGRCRMAEIAEIASAVIGVSSTTASGSTRLTASKSAASSVNTPATSKAPAARSSHCSASPSSRCCPKINTTAARSCSSASTGGA